MTAKSEPQWFRLGHTLMWQVPKAVYESLSEESRFTATNHNAIRCSIIHLIQCLELSIESNRKGQHAVSMCLLRQCAEALTIIELGLLRDFELGSRLLNDWLRGKKKLGEIRKRLGEQVGPAMDTDYGRRLGRNSFASLAMRSTLTLTTQVPSKLGRWH